LNGHKEEATFESQIGESKYEMDNPLFYYKYKTANRDGILFVIN